MQVLYPAKTVQHISKKNVSGFWFKKTAENPNSNNYVDWYIMLLYKQL